MADVLRAEFERACLIEIEALKPGNVHEYAGGHGMTAEDFRTSAGVAAPAIAARGISVGLRIASAVVATLESVHTNTNLGIVLLCAPLVHAGLAMEPSRGVTEGKIRAALESVLRALDVSDAEWAFAAIRRANPAGLGPSPRHDVNAPAKATLLEAMREAQSRDRIAFQYANGFVDVFATGVAELRAAQAKYSGAPKAETWAATVAYLAFLARFPDSHIARKHGCHAAEEVRARAAEIERVFRQALDPAALTGALIAFDSALKRRGLNPGTSADLTVASLLAVRLPDIFRLHTACRTGGLAP